MTTNDVERRLRAAYEASAEIVPAPANVADGFGATAPTVQAGTGVASTTVRSWRTPVWAAAAAAAVLVATFVATNAVSTGRSVSPTAQGTLAVPSLPATSLPSSTAPSGGSIANPVIGVGYPFRLVTHCGIRFALFGGRTWQAVGTPAVPVPKPNKDGTFSSTGDTPGTMTLLSTDQLRFVIDQSAVIGPTKIVMFRPTATRSLPCA